MCREKDRGVLPVCSLEQLRRTTGAIPGSDPDLQSEGSVKANQCAYLSDEAVLDELQRSLKRKRKTHPNRKHMV